MNTLYTRRSNGCFIAGDDFIRAAEERSSLLNGLVAHWRLDEQSGARIDAHGGNDLADVNTVGQAAGKVGNAASFVAGNEESLSLADNAALSMGNLDFTIAGWVWFDTLASTGLAGKWASGSLEYIVYFDGANLRLHVSSSGADNFSAVNSAIIAASTWYFFVAWHDAAADTLNLSVNNNAPASIAHTLGVHNGGAGFHLGRNEEGVSYLDGRLDSVSVWKRVLAAAERAQLYNSGNGLDYPFKAL